MRPLVEDTFVWTVAANAARKCVRSDLFRADEDPSLQDNQWVVHDGTSMQYERPIFGELSKFARRPDCDAHRRAKLKRRSKGADSPTIREARIRDGCRPESRSSLFRSLPRRRLREGSPSRRPQQLPKRIRLRHSSPPRQARTSSLRSQFAQRIVGGCRPRNIGDVQAAVRNHAHVVPVGIGYTFNKASQRPRLAFLLLYICCLSRSSPAPTLLQAKARLRPTSSCRPSVDRGSRSTKMTCPCGPPPGRPSEM